MGEVVALIKACSTGGNIYLNAVTLAKDLY